MSRFVGHLNPETHLLARTRPNSPDSCQQIDHLGIWFSEDTSNSARAWPRVAASMKRYLRVIHDFEIPDNRVCEALIDIYFATVHHFIPLVDERAFRQARRSNSLSIALMLAVILAACRDHRAKPFLRFASKDQLLPPREFAQRIYTHLTSLLKADAEKDKVTLIQVHALMSLHCEGPTGNETASLNLLTAIHYLQVLGMHLPRADEADKSGAFSRIFWCIWSLDRLNAAFNGRPTIIHERDMAHRAAFTCEAHETQQWVAFLIWLKLTDLLDKTIAFYRPGADPTSTGWETGFPSFEELITEDAQRISPDIIYTLEIYYHAIAILTSRYRDWNPVTASNAASIRQALSTLRMLQLVDEVPVSELPPLPIMPYTMTLSLSVTYRQCRTPGSIPTFNRAKRQLSGVYHGLEELATQWWFAEAMAKLGRNAMAKLRSYSHYNSQRLDKRLDRDQTAYEATGAEQVRRSTFEVDHASRSTDGGAINNTAQSLLNDISAVQALDTQITDSGRPSHDCQEISLSINEPTAQVAQGMIDNSFDYDWFLLDSIPNLLYPESGMVDTLFNDVSIFDGFETMPLN
ncbi:hypothetical protein LTR46_010474 [Exophiala xenobiotica]|nr:hypothetical protein LTR46_010474 [Exophiala xenobiotica]